MNGAVSRTPVDSRTSGAHVGEDACVTVEAPSFSPELFAFLRELAANNDREWFAANKARYVAEVQEPALAFIEDVGVRLPEVSRHLVVRAVPRRA